MNATRLLLARCVAASGLRVATFTVLSPSSGCEYCPEIMLTPFGAGVVQPRSGSSLADDACGGTGTWLFPSIAWRLLG
jgi:hypothetical protein